MSCGINRQINSSSNYQKMYYYAEKSCIITCVYSNFNNLIEQTYNIVIKGDLPNMTEERQIIINTDTRQITGKPQITHKSTIQSVQPKISTALDIVLYSLSATSKRQYQHTFSQWLQFAQNNEFTSVELSPENIIGFMENSQLAHSTKTTRLSHLRKLLEALHAQQPDNIQIESWYKQIKLLKVKRDVDTAQNEREKHALKPKQIHDAFAVWSDNTTLHKRNRALLAVLFYAGLRRSEAVVLQWRDIDFETGLITVKHGKGDKERTVPMLSDTQKEMLLEWYSITEERIFVFCGMRKGDTLGKDKPISTNAIWNVIKTTGHMIGVDNLAPHDARRTLLTNGLQSGANVADMQFIAGHSNPQTTLGYAIVKDAKEVAGRVKLNF